MNEKQLHRQTYNWLLIFYTQDTIFCGLRYINSYKYVPKILKQHDMAFNCRQLFRIVSTHANNGEI